MNDERQPENFVQLRVLYSENNWKSHIPAQKEKPLPASPNTVLD
jgi:hypothetical protein